MEESRSVFKVLSALLSYPDERLIEDHQELSDLVSRFSNSVVKAKCNDFLACVESIPLLGLQEEYTRLFDLNPSTCLNMTFHECGESRERGFALVRLIQLYKDAGYELSTKELPDYLPLILEFLSVCSSETRSKILTLYQSHIAGLASRLGEQEGCSYAGLVEALSTMVRELMGKGD